MRTMLGMYDSLCGTSYRNRKQFLMDWYRTEQHRSFVHRTLNGAAHDAGPKGTLRPPLLLKRSSSVSLVCFNLQPLFFPITLRF